ncbi:glutaredoxin [Dimargaris cristalligena]|uniref:Thioredoxin n=1 Tax=Dimargaris cristalligena TaxID=215637 RepID=A0A4P9ZNG9_9FUNG|nr:glutaredoxin [Dimargaris cristalligena]RKP34678.1 thioredoxin [Dimargaris cristalligena]|eukprot:RKP34678.1 thioredoxin [Dimargaris cristalligena]
MSPANRLELQKVGQLYSLLQDHPNTTIVIFFSADWAPQCKPMSVLFDELAKKYTALQFVKVEAEDFEEVAESYEVSAVPSFIFVHKLAIVDRVDGANAPEVSRLAEKHSKSSAGSSTTTDRTTVPTTQVKQDLNTRLKELTHRSPVMIFIKGTPTQPRCGFSKTLVGLLNDNHVKYGYFDILGDEEVRQGLKQYSSWPTYPQLYIEGELTGGLDIIKDMIQSGEFAEVLPAAAKA